MFGLDILIAKGRAFAKSSPLSLRYGVEALLWSGAVHIAVNNNNLFAQRLGATEFQLSMLQFLPQIIMLFLLVPAGFFADSLTNKRRMIAAALVFVSIFYALAGGSAFIPVAAVYFFIVFLSLSNVALGMYNLSWFAYFPEVVPDNLEAYENRNSVLTFRARVTMIAGFIIPLAVGLILTSIPSDSGKIAAHQVFYIIAAVLILSNAFHFKRFTAINPAPPKRVNFDEIKTASKRLIKNKPFIIFTVMILFFHMTWHADWTLYFIGQANYLHLNEFMLSITPVTATVAQLLTLKFWSKNNTRQGIEKPLAYGMMGLALCPLAIIIGLTLPGNFGIIAFFTLHFIGHLAFANIALNTFQCLLKVVDDEYRSFSISIYTCFITLSNAIMPVVGVALYHQLGIINTFVILFAARILAGVLWLIRVKHSKPKEEAI